MQMTEFISERHEIRRFRFMHKIYNSVAYVTPRFYPNSKGNFNIKDKEDLWDFKSKALNWKTCKELFSKL
jgi:hypothetical protein